MLYESGENYLETILFLKNRNGRVRSIDIANELGFSKPSISRAMGILKESGLITVDQSGWIDFTPEGRAQAESIYERHKLITEFLMQTLKLDKDAASTDACRIEHIISKEAFEKIKEFVKK